MKNSTLCFIQRLPPCSRGVMIKPRCKTDDILKAVRGDSYFHDAELNTYFHFINKYIVEGIKEADLDYLSESDTECLDEAISKCKDKSFDELTRMSHGLAWENTRRDRSMSFKDILREEGDSEDYVNYIAEKLMLESSYLRPF